MSAIWTTKDKRKIAVRDMSDRHLMNAYKFVRRAKEQAYTEGVAADTYGGSGDAALASAEAASGIAFDKQLLCNAWIDIFALELAKRELDKCEPEWERL